MKILELKQRMRQELRGVLKLSPLVLVSIVLAAFLWGADSAAISGLFQSSPVGPSPSATPTMAQAITPSVLPTDTVTVPITGTVAPAESAAPEETPSEVPPTETALPMPSSAPTEPPVTDTPIAEATAETGEPEATPEENPRYSEGESNLKFEWGMLFDAMALFFSYAWLICGILLFLAVPVFLFMLWRASDRRQEEARQGEAEQEEAQQEDD